MNQTESHLKARIIKASKLLQSKVGIGKIDEKKIIKSQHVIDNFECDFAPMGQDYLQEFKTAIEKSRNHRTENDDSRLIAGLVSPIMQIKGNASMFDYGLVGDLANIMLNFLETLESLDDHVVEIAEAHYKTLDLILKNNMKGDGGEYGDELRHELKDACKRYFAKLAAGQDFTMEENNDNVFFVDV